MPASKLNTFSESESPFFGRKVIVSWLLTLLLSHFSRLTAANGKEQEQDIKDLRYYLIYWTCMQLERYVVFPVIPAYISLIHFFLSSNVY